MYTLAGLLFEEPSRRNCVRVCACNVERKEGGGEERENVEKERERGGGGVHVPGMQLCRNPDCGRKLPRSLWLCIECNNFEMIVDFKVDACCFITIPRLCRPRG